MKNNILKLLAFIIIVSSCKKDDDNKPVNLDDVRVYTDATFYKNGNIEALTRYSYNQDGMINREMFFYVDDSVTGDTINVIRNYVDYKKTAEDTLLVIKYSSSSGHISSIDTSIWSLNEKGLQKELLKVLKWGGSAYSYWEKRDYDDNDYLIRILRINHKGDLLADTTLIGFYIEDGNSLFRVNDSIYTKTFYTDQIETRNYGRSFMGKINRNPVHQIIQGENAKTYSYSYIDGLIRKQHLSFEKYPPAINQMKSDSIPMISETYQDHWYTYIHL